MGPVLLAGCAWVVGELPEAADDRPVGAGGAASGAPATDAGDAGLGDVPPGAGKAGEGGFAGDRAVGGATAGDAGDASTAGHHGGAQNVGGEAAGGAGAGGDDSPGGGGISGAGESGASNAGKGGTDACDPCDCDGDGVLSADCNGVDCNDHDQQVKPGQTAYFLEPSPGHGFDYDCNTTIEYEEKIELTCDALACDEVTQAFIGTPSCGTEAAEWGRCVARSLLDCSPTVLSHQPVRCH